MTVGMTLTLNDEEKKALIKAADILQEIIEEPLFENCSALFYSGGVYSQVDFSDIADMASVLTDIAEAKDLEPGL